MTYREIMTYLKPWAMAPEEDGGVHGCPWYWGLEDDKEGWRACLASHNVSRRLAHGEGRGSGAEACRLCWGRDADEETVRTCMAKIQAAAAKKKGNMLTRFLRRLRG